MSRYYCFSGSRRLAGNQYYLCKRLALSLAKAGNIIVTGCAAGADAAVRSAVPTATIFRASDFGSGRAAFALRSIEMIRSLPSGSVVVGFPDRCCPKEIVSSGSASQCFCGSGSGTWATLAFAAGLRHEIYIFGACPKWGKWDRVVSGIFAGSFRLSHDPSLFG